MPYVFLALAICAEITATTLLKSSEGYTRLLPTAFSLLAYLICHCSFSRAVTKLNLGIAYAIWCGVGILVTAAISRVLFGERVPPAGNVGNERYQGAWAKGGSSAEAGDAAYRVG